MGKEKRGSCFLQAVWSRSAGTSKISGPPLRNQSQPSTTTTLPITPIFDSGDVYCSNNNPASLQIKNSRGLRDLIPNCPLIEQKRPQLNQFESYCTQTFTQMSRRAKEKMGRSATRTRDLSHSGVNQVAAITGCLSQGGP